MSETHNTLEDVLIDLLMKGSDRGALVRPGQVGKEPAVCVLMMSKVAIARLGPGLYELSLEMGDGGAQPIPGEPFDEQIGLGPMFEHADRSACKWGSFEMVFGRTLVRAVMFAGWQACARVAAICNANGAPCSLDPESAAPGYVFNEPRGKAGAA